MSSLIRCYVAGLLISLLGSAAYIVVKLVKAYRTSVRHGEAFSIMVDVPLLQMLVYVLLTGFAIGSACVLVRYLVGHWGARSSAGP